MKKLFAGALAVVLGLSVLSVGVAAEEPSADTTAAAIRTAAKADAVEYTDYAAQYAQIPAATDEVPLANASAAFSADAQVEAHPDETGTAVVLDWKNGDGSITWTFTVPQEGMYNLAVDYLPLSDATRPLTVDVWLDGAQPFDGLDQLELPRIWVDDGALRVDGIGNEFAPEQKQEYEWQQKRLTDAEGLLADPFLFYLAAGDHTLTFYSSELPFSIGKVAFVPAEKTESYKTVSAAWKDAGYKNYDGKPLKIEGEAAVRKSSNSLVGQADNGSASVTPNDPTKSRVNYIGGGNWSGAGDTITWTVDAPQDGLYQLGIHYQQSYLMNSSCYRVLRIDGEIPFTEAKELKFDYCTDWKMMTVADADKNPYLFYLSAGEHTVSLSVTLGEFSEFAQRLQVLIYDLGEMYRQLIMITGDSPDANRDYNLFEQIPNFRENLQAAVDELKALQKIAEDIGGKSNSTTSTIKSMAAVIKRMLDYDYQAQIYKGSYYDNYSSLSAWLYELTSMPIDVDCFYFGAPNGSYGKTDANFFESFVFGTRRFLNSLVGDYNNISGNSDAKEKITLWINWGRDQVQVLNYLIKSDFTTSTGIGVNIKMTNASLIQALLSGNGPDCYLRMSRTDPVNLALRGALYDLKNFDDFDEVCSWFMPTSTVPYEFGGGTYALPDSQTFNVMFYRKDIFEELKLSVPNTWDEFIAVSSVIMRNNMEVGLPYTQITDMNLVNIGLGGLNLFPTLLMQCGGSLYDEKLSGLQLTSPESIQAFTMWTDFYNKYSFPVTYDFYNRFRIGVMPLAVQGYTNYTTITGAASEIKNLWSMAPVPGVLQPDGTIDRTQAGGGSGCAILKESKNKEATWEFLKWWVGGETQYRYSANVESILGVTGRNTTSNIEAFKRLDWEGDDLEILLDAWDDVREMPEVPGGYYVPRVVDQAFWNVVNNNKSVQSMLLKWDAVADNEIAEKRAQYNVQ